MEPAPQATQIVAAAPQAVSAVPASQMPLLQQACLHGCAPSHAVEQPASVQASPGSHSALLAHNGPVGDEGPLGPVRPVGPVLFVGPEVPVPVVICTQRPLTHTFGVHSLSVAQRSPRFTC